MGISKVRQLVPQRARLWLLTAVVIICGCSREQVTYVTLPLGGSSPERWVGEWYSSEGRLELDVHAADSGGYEVLIRTLPSTYRAVIATAELDGIRLVLRGPERHHQVELRRVWGLNLLPPGSDACLMAHNYWLFRNPSMAWLSARSAETRIRAATIRAKLIVDWVIREL
jgi:hypothetical protein